MDLIKIQQKQRYMKPINLLIVAGLIGNFFFGQIGAFAMIKYPIAQDFQFSQSFLGFLDTLRHFGTFFGTIWILMFPLQKLKRAFFLYSAVKCILIFLLVLGKIFPQSVSVYFSLLMFGIGFTKNVNFSLYVIVNKNMDLQNESQLNMYLIWGNFLFLGDVFSILLGEFIMNYLNLSWTIYITIFSLVFMCSNFLFYAKVNEVQAQKEEDSEDKSIKKTFTYMFYILKQPRRLLSILNIVVISLCYYNVLLWYPYYFSLIDFKDYATIFSIVCPISICLGGIFLESFLKLCPKHDNFIITILLVVLAFANYALILIHQNETLQNRNQIIILYFIFIAISNLALSGPFNRMFIKEIYEETDGTIKMNYYIITLYTFFRCVFAMVDFYLTGQLLEYDQKFFFWITFVMSLILLMTDTLKRWILKRTQKQQKVQEHQMLEMKLVDSDKKEDK